MTLAVVVGLITGLILGGVANLLIQRVPKRLSLIHNPGRALRGQRAALVTLVLAGLVAGIAWRYGLSPTFGARALYALLLVTLLIVDWQHHLIPNVIIYPAIALAAAASLLTAGPGLRDAGLGGLIGGGLFFVLFVIGGVVFRQEALGFGDVRLAFFLGLAAGYPNALPVLLLGIVLAGLAAVVVIISRRRGRKDFIPYGTFLCLAAVPFLLYLEA